MLYQVDGQHPFKFKYACTPTGGQLSNVCLDLHSFQRIFGRSNSELVTSQYIYKRSMEQDVFTALCLVPVQDSSPIWIYVYLVRYLHRLVVGI